MSRNSLLRRSIATAAAAGALTMAFQPSALAAPFILHYGNIVTHDQWDVSGVAAPPASDRAAQPTGETSTTRTVDTVTRIFELTNAERTKAGLQPLQRNDCLDRGAQEWSDRMSREQRMYHSDLRSWMGGCDLNRVGENVARGGGTAERTVQMWMESPSHRENILDPRFTQLGVGWSADGSFATQRFGG